MLCVICLCVLVCSVLSDNATNDSIPNQIASFNKTEVQNVNELSSKEPLARGVALNLSSVITNVTFSDFKPSLPVDSFYERNKFTVPPAFPEAKIYSQPWKESSSAAPWLTNPAPSNNWRQTHWNDIASTTGTTSNKGIKFPSSGERPYRFESIYGDPAPVLTTERSHFDRPVKPEMIPPRSPRPTTGIGGFWNKLMGTEDTSSKDEHGPMQKTFYDYNLMEKPQPYVVPYKEYDAPAYGVTGHSGYGGYGGGYGGGYAEHEGYGGGYGKFGSIGHISPWKKIIKFLAAIIPIGLFLSALTPTVIHVQSVNDTTLTQSRYRTEDRKDDLAQRLANSLSYFNKLNDDGCEDKVLCELLVSASLTKNSEENIKHLLDNFVKNEDLESKKEDLLKIFDAVREQDCSPIICKSIDNPT
nr:unnamed protein product [Callosobruchus chinensis]